MTASITAIQLHTRATALARVERRGRSATPVLGSGIVPTVSRDMGCRSRVGGRHAV